MRKGLCLRLVAVMWQPLQLSLELIFRNLNLREKSLQCSGTEAEEEELS